MVRPLEIYNKRMHISEAFEDSLRNLRQERACIYHPINKSDESQEISVLINEDQGQNQTKAG